MKRVVDAAGWMEPMDILTRNIYPLEDLVMGGPDRRLANDGLNSQNAIYLAPASLPL